MAEEIPTADYEPEESETPELAWYRPWWKWLIAVAVFGAAQPEGPLSLLLLLGGPLFNLVGDQAMASLAGAFAGWSLAVVAVVFVVTKAVRWLDSKD